MMIPDILSVALLLRVVECSVKLEFQFHQYTNPSGLKHNDNCCDDFDVGSFSIFCYSQCDTFISRICLGPGGSSTEPCPWSDYVLIPGTVGGDDIQFTNNIGSISNPFTFTVPSQMDSFQLYVEVIDDDSSYIGGDPLADNELIDEVFVQIPGIEGEFTSQTFTGIREIISLVLSYSLTCAPNYYGTDCSTFCIPSDNSAGHYNCNPYNGNKICLPGYQNPETNCIEVDCDLICTGQGSCSESGECVCSEEWSGEACDQAQCAENCHPVGGYCDQPGECLCNHNWNGSDCDQFLCHPNCSTMGGTCAVAGECNCLPDYTGEYCETDLNPCSHLTPCENGGTCSNGDPDQYSCACPSGFTGVNCEEDIDECQVASCLNDATCIDKVGGYECLCVLGWMGANCSDNIDECVSQPCQQGGNCTDLVNGYYCSCPVEYEGLNCDLMVNACIPDPCRNGGSCNNFITDYTCDCLPGFTGKNCIVLPSTSAMSATPSPSVTSSDAIATSVIAGTVTAVLLVFLAVVVGLVVMAGVVLCTRKKQKVTFVSQSSSDTSQSLTLFKEGKTCTPNVSPMAEPRGWPEKDVPNPLYDAGQAESGTNSSTACYEPVDVTEAENPMYVETLPRTEQLYYSIVNNPMYTNPQQQTSSGAQQVSSDTQTPVIDGLHKPFEREVDNPLYTLEDNDSGSHDDMVSNPMYTDVQSHKYEYIAVTPQDPAPQ